MNREEAVAALQKWMAEATPEEREVCQRHIAKYGDEVTVGWRLSKGWYFNGKGVLLPKWSKGLSPEQVATMEPAEIVERQIEAADPAEREGLIRRREELIANWADTQRLWREYQDRGGYAGLQAALAERKARLRQLN